MTQPPPYSPPPFPPQGFPPGFGYPYGPRQTNGPAVASLVLGIFGCIPFLTGLLAVVLGIIGIRKSRDPSVGGNAMALTGMSLGAVSVLGWGVAVGFIRQGFLDYKPAISTARQFIQDVNDGNYVSALDHSSGLTLSQLQTLNARISQFGAIQSVNLNSFNFNTYNSEQRIHLGGIITFANGQKTCTIDLLKSDGKFKVTSYWLNAENKSSVSEEFGVGVRQTVKDGASDSTP